MRHRLFKNTAEKNIRAIMGEISEEYGDIEEELKLPYPKVYQQSPSSSIYTYSRMRIRRYGNHSMTALSSVLYVLSLS